MLDFTVPAEHKLKMKGEKMDKYIEQQKWNMNVTMITIITLKTLVLVQSVKSGQYLYGITSYCKY